MYSKGLAILFFLLTALRFPIIAQTIKGEVIDMDDKTPVNGVYIENIYTSLGVSTNKDGAFIIAASKDELLEFKKTGYKTVKVRIPKGYVPSYFKIILEHGITRMDDALTANGNRYDYVKDSIRNRNIYQHELDFPKLSAAGSIAHPFSAMSGRNRDIWRFQETYNSTEQEKYVDRTFNAELVTKFTGLTGDSLKYYMVKYRPTYVQLKGMNDYSFFTFIKKTVHSYRARTTPRGAQ